MFLNFSWENVHLPAFFMACSCPFAARNPDDPGQQTRPQLLCHLDHWVMPLWGTPIPLDFDEY